jgi:hypothetical protein
MQHSSLQVKNYWGFLSPQGEGENIKKGNLRCLFAAFPKHFVLQEGGKL